MTGMESFPISFEKLVSIAQRYRWWIHVLLFPLGWAVLYASFQLPPLDSLVQWILSGTSKLDSLVMEWGVLLQLALARIHPLDEDGYHFNEWGTGILFFSTLFVLPQILFWAFRTKRNKMFWGIILAITINVFSLYMHRFYCVWSFNRVSTMPVTLKTEDLFRQCGGPLYYRKDLNGVKPCWLGFYTDGFLVKIVYFMDDGTAHINRVSGLWMD